MLRTTKVFVAIYEHRHGDDIHLYAVGARANEWRQEIAAEYWDEEMDDRTKPECPQEAADAYFEHHETEFFSCSECEIIQG